MLGLCLFGWRALPRFAVHCPIGFVLVLALASCASAVFMRLAPRLGMQARRGASGAGSRTAHTVIMSYEEQLTSAKPGKAAAREPGAARSTEEPAGEE
jgi:hypothetical protein